MDEEKYVIMYYDGGTDFRGKPLVRYITSRRASGTGISSKLKDAHLFNTVADANFWLDTQTGGVHRDFMRIIPLSVLLMDEV